MVAEPPIPGSSDKQMVTFHPCFFVSHAFLHNQLLFLLNTRTQAICPQSGSPYGTIIATFSEATSAGSLHSRYSSEYRLARHTGWLHKSREWQRVFSHSPIHAIIIRSGSVKASTLAAPRGLITNSVDRTN